MTRPLVAFAALVALLAAAWATWWVLEGPSDALEIAPGAGPAQAQASSPAERLATGGDGGGRHAAPGATSSEPSDASGEAEDPTRFPVEVAVADLGGAPVVGARVLVEQPVSVHGRTDELGLARVALPADARSLVLRVEAPGFFHGHLDATVAPRLDVTLYPAVHARGRVLDRATHAPIAQARVRIEDGHDDCDAAGATTDDQGAFELEAVPEGLGLLVSAAAEGYADSSLPVQVLPDSDGADLELLLERTAGVQLLVVDHLNGRPVSSARLLDVPDSPVSDATGRLDASRLVATSDQVVSLSLEAPGYCRLQRGLTAEEWSSGAPVAVPMLPGARFEGIVRDAQGAGVPLATVSARLRTRGARPSVAVEGWRREWTLGPLELAPLSTDAGGRFSTASVPPLCAGWQLEVSAKGLATQRIDPGSTAAPGQATWVEVRLETLTTGTIRGTLRLNDKPVGGLVRWSGPTSQGSAPATPNGRFELQHVEAGEVTLSAEPTDGRQRYGKLAATQVRILLEAGATLVQDVDLRLPMARTSGHVVTQLGTAVPGADVLAWTGDRQATLWTTTVEDGAFELDLPELPQPWMLRVRGPWRNDPVAARAGERDVRLVVSELGRLRVRLVDAASGKALRAFELRGGPVGGGRRFLESTVRTAPDPAGWLELEAPTGALDLTARALDEAWPPVSETVVVPPANAPAAQLELRTTRGNRLVLVLMEDSERPPHADRLYVLDEDVAARLPAGGDPQARWKALMDQQTGGELLSLRRRSFAFDLKRRARLRGLPDGRYRLVDIDGGRFEPELVELPGASGAPVEVSWQAP